MVHFFATSPKGSEPLLAAELEQLGALEVRPARAGVAFEGPLELGYRACLWLRTASRVLLRLAAWEAVDSDSLYAGARAVDWPRAFDGSSLAVDASGTSDGLRDERFSQRRIKDAVVDAFREAGRPRPGVDTRAPALRLNLRLAGRRASLSVDLAGRSLHARGYRRRAGEAPLREDLAAALLLRGRWPAIAAEGGALLDPMCGAATILAEGAWMAADVAPGLLEAEFGGASEVPGSPGWRDHAPTLWRGLVAEARERRAAGLSRLPPLFGRDADPEAIRAARENLARAGLLDHVDLEVAAMDEVRRPAVAHAGLVATNPPYGERLEDEDGARQAYADLGALLRSEFTGWKAAIIEGRPGLGFELGLRARRRYPFFNGPIEGRILCLDVAERDFVEAREKTPPPPAEDFANRLRKNVKRLDRWARRAGTDAYRIYDADLPEYAVAVDRYADWVCVQEYEAPPSVEPARARARLAGALAAIPEVLGMPAERVVLKRRRRQRGLAQYEKQDARGEMIEVHEGQARLLVNLHDYLDTGLFLDHRVTRQRVAEMAQGKSLLNLFCYTGSVTVQAALAGARRSVSVDLSRTYLDWAARNFELNGLDLERHRVVHDDVMAWLERPQGRFDVVFVDPPTFSNSKRMDGTFDVQRDHAELLVGCLRALAPGGVIVFSTNRRRFTLDEALERRFDVHDISAETIPEDFKRRPKIHRAYELRPSVG